MKKILYCIVAVCLSFSLIFSAFAAAPQFGDVSADKWYYTWVTKAAQAGWVSGVGGGKYEPGKSVTYSQFAVMLGKALYPNDMAAQPKGDYWWTPACEVAAKHGLFTDTDMANRSDWTAVANKPIEREQMAQMMYNALTDVGAKLPSYAEYSEVALGIADIIDCDNYDAVATCYAIKLLNGTGNGNFDPHSDMTRAQAAVVLCNIYGYVTGDVTGSTTTTPNEPDVPDEPEKPAQPDVPRPAGAVGGRYDTSVYDVPADSNKDGWITEAEVQAVLNQLRVKHPNDSQWKEPGSVHYVSPTMGGANDCAAFAYYVSDCIFGNLPRRIASYDINQAAIGDMLHDKQASHWSVVYESLAMSQWDDGSYLTVDGGADGRWIWDFVQFADEWPSGTQGIVYSRYPQG